MKKIALWLAVMALGLCLGCQGSILDSAIQNKHKHKNPVEINLKFREGQTVKLVIGGRGQVVKVHPNREKPYLVRVNTNGGPTYLYFREFELEITP